MPLIHVCTGSCHGAVSDEIYNKGKTVCGGNCEKRGMPFEKRIQCASCAKRTKEEGKIVWCERCIR